MKKKQIWIFVGSAFVIALLFPRKIDSNTTIDWGYGSLRLRGYAISIPFLPALKFGQWTAYYGNGALGEEKVYRFGFPQTFREFYPDGTLKRKGQFQRGRPHGEWLSYYPNGNIHIVYTHVAEHDWFTSQKLYSDKGELVSHIEEDKVLIDRTEEFYKEYKQSPQPNTGNRPASGDSPATENPPSLDPLG